jgi:hypothetical protein
MPPRKSSGRPTIQARKDDKLPNKQIDADRRAGISHFPLQEERDRQQNVPPRGTSKDRTKTITGQGTQGHRRSKVQGRQAFLDSEGSFEGKGGKGGKTGGSRAGLLASRKRPKGRR